MNPLFKATFRAGDISAGLLRCGKFLQNILQTLANAFEYVLCYTLSPLKTLEMLLLLHRLRYIAFCLKRKSFETNRNERTASRAGLVVEMIWEAWRVLIRTHSDISFCDTVQPYMLTSLGDGRFFVSMSRSDGYGALNQKKSAATEVCTPLKQNNICFFSASRADVKDITVHRLTYCFFVTSHEV